MPVRLEVTNHLVSKVKNVLWNQNQNQNQNPNPRSWESLVRSLATELCTSASKLLQKSSDRFLKKIQEIHNMSRLKSLIVEPRERELKKNKHKIITKKRKLNTHRM